ncbi:Sex peptide receptor [Eumeta japonica]|uniref:Sex peptide receptor n=1 Tax=Eumeta variegata TaxID=151549 RepID=A0A4C1UHZ7_EUMVA|nr:Sex peptide receptor [Eumeta japonica]
MKRALRPNLIHTNSPRASSGEAKPSVAVIFTALMTTAASNSRLVPNQRGEGMRFMTPCTMPRVMKCLVYIGIAAFLHQLPRFFDRQYLPYETIWRGHVEQVCKTLYRPRWLSVDRGATDHSRHQCGDLVKEKQRWRMSQAVASEAKIDLLDPDRAVIDRYIFDCSQIEQLTPWLNIERGHDTEF